MKVLSEGWDGGEGRKAYLVVSDSASLQHRVSDGIVYFMEFFKGDDQNCLFHLKSTASTKITYILHIRSL